MKKTNYALLLCAGLFATGGFANDNVIDDTDFSDEEVIVIDCAATPELPECINAGIGAEDEISEEPSEEMIDNTEEFSEEQPPEEMMDNTEEFNEDEQMIDCTETPDDAECRELLEEIPAESTTP